MLVLIGASLIVLLFLSLVLLRIIIHSFVFLKLWEWFIVPFFGLSMLTLSYSVGICAIFNLLFSNVVSNLNKEQTLQDKFTVIIASFLLPFLYLLIGWVAKLFIG